MSTSDSHPPAPDAVARSRRALQLDEVRSALAPWEVPVQPHVLAVCESTNDEAARLVASLPAGSAWQVVVADHQTAGRGRLDRQWQTPEGAGLLVSVAIPVSARMNPATVGLVPLVAGLAVARTCRGLGVAAQLKWPNDVLAGPEAAKLAGILTERRTGWVIMGIGLNVTTTAEEAPGLALASLATAGASQLDRAVILGRLVGELAELWQQLLTGGARLVLTAYRNACATLGVQVRATLPGGEVVAGVASEIDANGHLVITSAGRQVVVSAGDVVHVRPDPHPS